MEARTKTLDQQSRRLLAQYKSGEIDQSQVMTEYFEVRFAMRQIELLSKRLALAD
jgi:hypothetical protein